MKQKPKKLWLEALRSGKYTQGHGVLKTEDDEFCCLGVLCEVYRKTQKKKGWTFSYYKNSNSKRFKYFYFRESYTRLPNEVAKWAGININPIVGSEFGGSLSSLNDNGLPFEDIADLIEVHL